MRGEARAPPGSAVHRAARLRRGQADLGDALALDGLDAQRDLLDLDLVPDRGLAAEGVEEPS